MGSPERYWRFFRHQEFAVAEVSLGAYLAALPSGRYTAVPVFPHRRFRPHYAFVRREAGIRHPRQLEGRRVAVMTWQATAGLWLRGILQNDYRVDLQRVHWVVQGEEFVPQRPRGFRPEPAAGDPQARLLAGELDGLLYPETLPALTAGDARVGRLFADPRAEEIQYCRRTGIFARMHVLTLQRPLAEAYPWLPEALVPAWTASQDRAGRRWQQPAACALAWLAAEREQQAAVLGPDPWQAGLTATNRRALATWLRYACEQGICERCYRPEELFWPPPAGPGAP